MAIGVISKRDSSSLRPPQARFAPRNDSELLSLATQTIDDFGELGFVSAK